MKRAITIFDAATGAYCYSVDAHTGDEDQFCAEGQGWREGEFDPDTHRVNPATRRVIKLRPLPIKRVGNRVTGIPVDARVSVTGRAVPHEGEVHVALVYPQSVNLRISHPLFADATLQMDCTPEEPTETSITWPQDLSLLRRAEYEARGLTIEALTVAQFEGDEAEIERIRLERAEVKAALPKS